MKPNLKQVARISFLSGFNVRIFGWVFIVMMIATAIYVSRQTRMYEAKGELEIPMPAIRAVENVLDASISCGVDMNTVHEVMTSQLILRGVIGRLTPEDRRLFLRPYGGRADHSDEDIKRLILENRTMKLIRKTLKWEMRYRHPDRHMASRIVELFLREGQAYEARVKADDATMVRQYLEQRAEQARQKVQICEQAVFAYQQSRLTISGGEQEAKETYQSLIKKTEIEANLYKQILARLSEMHAADKSAASGWRISQAPITRDEDDYLMAPLVVSAAGGLAIAMITGVLAALLFKRTTIPSNQPEAL
ncbi:MAG: hypothetical protein H7Y06_09935 [Opitutaceae bacterium]|nr:hypothetical protein [Opitutaceae bacterium]